MSYYCVFTRTLTENEPSANYAVIEAESVEAAAIKFAQMKVDARQAVPKDIPIEVVLLVGRKFEIDLEPRVREIRSGPGDR